MNRNHRSRLERLERTAAESRASSRCSARLSDDGLDALSVEELLALPGCSLTMEDIQLAEELAANARAAEMQTNGPNEMENER